MGQLFPDAALLDDKLQELAELEADLATTRGEFEPGGEPEVTLLDLEAHDDTPLPPRACATEPMTRLDA